MIIAITGPDGAGKSTLCQKVFSYFEEKHGKGSVIISSAWDVVTEAQLFSSRLKAEEYLNGLEGVSRTLFILHCITHSLKLALSKNPKFILIDSYWYKYVVSEIGLGISSNWIFELVKELPTPDYTFYLDISPIKAAKRKNKISLYEQGYVKHGNSHSNFIEFQLKLRSIWKKIEQDFGPWIHINSQNELSDTTIHFLQNVIFNTNYYQEISIQ